MGENSANLVTLLPKKKRCKVKTPNDKTPNNQTPNLTALNAKRLNAECSGMPNALNAKCPL
jgi:hypothetical protein